MTTELAIKDSALLEMLNGLTNKNDTGGEAPQIPVLKMNYDPDSKHPRGAWIVGQRKDQDGNITEEGVEVKAIYVLTVRNRFSYYDSKDPSKSCNSRYFLKNDTEPVVGSNLGNVCGNTCPLREKGINPRCKAQQIYFALAVAGDGRLIECVGYLSGMTYWPAMEHAKLLGKLKIPAKGGYMKIPPFSVATILSSTKEKNAGTTYFVGGFAIGPPIKDAEQAAAFDKKRMEAYAYIEQTNNMFSVKPSASFSPAPVEIKPVSGHTEGSPIVPEIMPDMETTAPPSSPAGSGAPWSIDDEPKAEPAGNDDFDIESAISKALAA